LSHNPRSQCNPRIEFCLSLLGVGPASLLLCWSQLLVSFGVPARLNPVQQRGATRISTGCDFLLKGQPFGSDGATHVAVILFLLGLLLTSLGEVVLRLTSLQGVSGQLVRPPAKLICV
jgi:hypothetical protein